MSKPNVHVVHIHEQDGDWFTECRRYVSMVEDSDSIAARFYAADSDLGPGYRYCKACKAKHNSYAVRYGERSRDSAGRLSVATSYGGYVKIAG